MVDKTIITYQSQIRAVSNHLDANVTIENITKSDLEKMVTSIRNSNFFANSISTYVRILRVFLCWCNEEGITNLNIEPWYARCDAVGFDGILSERKYSNTLPAGEI